MDGEIIDKNIENHEVADTLQGEALKQWEKDHPRINPLPADYQPLPPLRGCCGDAANFLRAVVAACPSQTETFPDEVLTYFTREHVDDYRHIRIVWNSKSTEGESPKGFITEKDDLPLQTITLNY